MTNIALLKLAHKIQIYWFERGVQCDIDLLEDFIPFITIGNKIPLDHIYTEDEILHHAKEIGVL